MNQSQRIFLLDKFANMSDVNEINDSITPTVICVKVSCIRKNKKDTHVNLKTWCNDENNLYIGRAGIVFVPNPDGTGKERFPKKDSKWSNPFKIKNMSRDDVINKYREYINEKIVNNTISINELKELSGKTLGCWCKPEPCHGDVLIEMFNKYVK